MWRQKTRHQGENSFGEGEKSRQIWVCFITIELQTITLSFRHPQSIIVAHIFIKSHITNIPHTLALFAFFFYVMLRTSRLFAVTLQKLKCFFFCVNLLCSKLCVEKRDAFTSRLNWLMKIVESLQSLKLNFVPFFKSSRNLSESVGD